jgi:hypothetical protein
MLPNLLPDVIRGIKNTIFCHKKEMQSLKNSKQILVYFIKGGFTVKLMKLKLQGPFQGTGRGPRHVFIWSYVFVKFAKVKYFNHNQFNLLSLSNLTSPLSHFPSSHVVLEWLQAFLQSG